MISIRSATAKPPPRTRKKPAHVSALAPLAAEHMRLRADNVRLKQQNTALKLALARAAAEKAGGKRK